MPFILWLLLLLLIVLSLHAHGINAVAPFGEPELIQAKLSCVFLHWKTLIVKAVLLF